MDIISSTQNRLVKLARSLVNKKFRTETGLFLVEGVNLLRDMPSYVPVEFVFATEARMQEAKAMFASRKVSEGLFSVSDAVMEAVADTSSPYGIVAVCKIPTVEFKLPESNALLLDGVSDAGNIGTILRTAVACGFSDVYMLDTADVYSPKLIRASLGALFKARVYTIDESQAVLLMQSCNSAVLDMSGQNILKSKVQAPVLFVAGSEAHGVRDRLKHEAKQVFSLPMKNQIESLNVAVAAAVAMYQTV